MDTLGPRVMVNVGTQAVSNPGLNPRDLAPLTNDAFLATFMGKPALPTSNGMSRQQNNYRQTYTTQMDRAAMRSKSRQTAANGDSIEPDSAILSIIRGNGTDNSQQHSSQRTFQGSHNRRRSFNQQLNGWNDIPCSPNYRPTNDASRRRRTRSGGVQQQITVVDQMAAQPHIPYAILPKRFEPKQVSSNGSQQQSRVLHNNNNNNNNTNRNNGNRRHHQAAPRRSHRQHDYYDDQWEDEEDEDLWLEPMAPMMRRQMGRRVPQNYGRVTGSYGPRQHRNEYYDSYPYAPLNRQGPIPAPLRARRRMMYQDENFLPFNIVPSYDLNEWQGPYARSKRALQSQQRGPYRNGYKDAGFIRDDHRLNGSSRQSRNGYKPSTPTRRGKQTKSPHGKEKPKRRTSRQRKQRNQNSKTEGTPLTHTNEMKSTTDNETSDERKSKDETTTLTLEQKPLPPRDQEKKELNGEKTSD